VIDDFTILSLSPSYQISDSIWWQRKLPSETVYEPLPVVFVLYEILWKSSPIPTNITNYIILLYIIIVSLNDINDDFDEDDECGDA